MLEGVDLYRTFAERFHSGKRLRPASKEQLTDAEVALGVLWPEAYRQFSMTCGALYTPGLLDLIVEHKADFGDVQQFLTPKQSITETRRWHLEPQGGCVAFASNCEGSFYAFRQLSTTKRQEDAAVWLFDHEAGEIVEQANSFEEWIDQFLKL